MTARATLDRAVTEAEFSAAVARYARLRGFVGYHAHDSRRSEAGFPDWVFVRPPRLVFAELKTERGRATPEQLGWIDRLNAAGDECVTAHLWRASDWPEIEQVLR